MVGQHTYPSPAPPELTAAAGGVGTKLAGATTSAGQVARHLIAQSP